MQYRRLKNMKRVVAAIVSAALIITAQPQMATTTLAAQVSETKQAEETEEVSDVKTEESAQESSNVQASETESSNVENADTENTRTESSDTEDTDSGTTNTESSRVDTETTSTENADTENSDIENASTENSDMESSDIESSDIESSDTESSDTENTNTESPETETSETSGSETESEGEDDSASLEDIETETAGTEELTDLENAEEETTEEEIFVSVPIVDTQVHEFEELEILSVTEHQIASIYSASARSLTEVAENTYRIENKDQFIEFLVSSSDYTGKTVNLACDIDMKSDNLSFDRSFNGTFNGNGHSISNIKTEQGLFQSIGTKGEVKELHISNATMTGKSSGGIIAGVNSGTIFKCVVTGNLESTETMQYTAGIAGANADLGKIEECVFAGKITATAATKDAAKNIGGIAGDNNGTIKNCYAVGSIQTNAAKIAGIAGANEGTVSNCANYMTVEGAYTIAGIVAYNTGDISGCLNYGTIKQTSYSDGEAAGIAAQNTRAGLISNSYNYGQISGESKDIAGIAGANAGEITKCGNYGAIEGMANCGGIVGLYNGTRRNVIDRCFNIGTITGKGTTDKAVGLGGILGSSEEGYEVPIENCYNTGKIQITGNVRYVGGIAGIMKEGTVKNCYNAGKITGADEQSVAAMLVGFLGDEEKANYENCLFISGNQEYACYRGGTNHIIDEDAERTASELKSSTVLAVLGSSFAEDSSEINSGYPIISGQSAEIYQYPLIYELNGGCADYYFDLVEDKASIGEPAAPTKRNADFLGWCSDPDCNIAFRFDSITEATVIYAHWENYIAVEDLALAQKSTMLIWDEEFEIKVLFTPENAKNTALVWASKDESIATVNENGKVKAGNVAGTTRITCSLADKSLDKVLEFEVTVLNEDNKVRIRRASDGVEIKELLVAVNEPQDVQAVSAKKIPNSDVKWRSSDPNIVAVEPNTNTLEGGICSIKGLKPGTANVYVMLTDKDKDKVYTESIEVTVRPLATAVYVKLGDENVTDKTVTYDLVTKRFIAVGNVKLDEPIESFSSSVSPQGTAARPGASQKVIWSSDNTSVIKFNDKEVGIVEGNRNGTANITATANDGSKDKDGKPIAGNVTVNAKRIVQSLVMEPKEVSKDMPVVTDENGRILLTSGCSVKFDPKFTPSDVTEERLRWDITKKDSKEKPVEIDADRRIVTAKDVTEDTRVTITVTSLDEGGASYDINFTIKPKVTKIEIFKTDDMKHSVNGQNIGINPEKDDMIFTLRAVNQPDNASQVVTWKSSNTKVASIEDKKDGSCVVTAKMEGSARITATAADKSGITATTTINISALAASLQITGSNKVVKGGTIKLNAEILPKSTKDKSVEWWSETKEVATIDSNGYVTGKLAGSAIIKARAKDGGGAESSFTVIVTEQVEYFDLIKQGGDIDKEDDIITNKTIGIDLDLALETGSGLECYRLTPRILPKEACQIVEWKSSDEKVATVSDTGLITAKGLGTANITAWAIDGSGKKASVTVNVATLVKDISVSGSHYVGAHRSIQLKADVRDKDAQSKMVNWTSSANDVATVDATGKVMAVAESGHVWITAEAADGSGVKVEHRVHIMGKGDDIDIAAVSHKLEYTTEDKKYITLDLADRETLDVNLTADLSGGTENFDGDKKIVEWTTSDKTIAEITNEGGVTTAGDSVRILVKKTGTVRITAKTAEGFGKTDVCELRIENTNPVVRITGPTQVAKGKKIQLSTGNTAVTWASEDTKIATVDQTGKVTAKKNIDGVWISATAKTGTNMDRYYVSVEPAVKKVDITLNGEIVTKKKLGLDIVNGYNGTQLDLDAMVDGADNNSITWKSNKTSIVTVDKDGKVEIKGIGTAVVTATATDGSNKSGKVTLVVSKQITGIAPADGNKNVYVGKKKSVQLKLAYRPLAATTKNVTWKSSEPSVVSVNKNGKITAKKSWDSPVTITASAAENGNATCEFLVYVTTPASKVKIGEYGKSYESNITAYPTIIGIDMDVNASQITLATDWFDSKNNPILEGDKKVTWKSSNTSIATVDENGVVTGLEKGKTTITATAADGSKKVGKITLYVGKLIRDIVITDPDINGDGGIKLQIGVKSRKTLQLSEKIQINPITASNPKLTYKSSNTKVVSVNASGKVTGKKAGTAEIIVSTTDGSGVSIKIPVTVIK